MATSRRTSHRRSCGSRSWSSPHSLRSAGSSTCPASSASRGAGTYRLEEWLHPVIEFGEAEIEGTFAYDNKYLLVAIAVACALGGIALAWLVYQKKRAKPIEPALLARGWDYDAAISWFMGNPGREASRRSPTSTRTVVDGAVNGVATAVRATASETRKAQTGYVRQYAGVIGIGVVLLLELVRGDSRNAVMLAAGGAAGAFPILSALIFVPMIGAVAILFTQKSRPEYAKLIALLASVVTAAMSVWLLASFDTADAGFQLVSQHTWIEQWGIGWHLGVDGISLFLVVLTGLLFPLAIVGIDPHHDEKPYLAWLLMLEAGVIGSFLSLDLFLFFLFFEIVLVPMYFLIGGWGYESREYAATKFFLYTILGSAFMLVALIATAMIASDDLGAGDLRSRRDRRGRRLRGVHRSMVVLRRSPSRSRSRCRSSRCTRGCPTPTPRRRPPARSSWPA